MTTRRAGAAGSGGTSMQFCSTTGSRPGEDATPSNSRARNHCDEVITSARRRNIRPRCQAEAAPRMCWGSLFRIRLTRHPRRASPSAISGRLCTSIKRGPISLIVAATPLT